MVSAGTLVLCLDARVLGEYEEVLLRPKFEFDSDDVAALLDYIEFSGEIVAGVPLPIRLPDSDDEAFLEVALACRAEYLVTGNLAHFPLSTREGVSVLTPGEFVDEWRGRNASGRT